MVPERFWRRSIKFPAERACYSPRTSANRRFAMAAFISFSSTARACWRRKRLTVLPPSSRYRSQIFSGKRWRCWVRRTPVSAKLVRLPSISCLLVDLMSLMASFSLCCEVKLVASKLRRIDMPLGLPVNSMNRSDDYFFEGGDWGCESQGNGRGEKAKRRERLSVWHSYRV